MFKFILFICLCINYAHADSIMLDPYYKGPEVLSNIEVQVPLKKFMAYDCKTDGHNIIIKESSFNGIPLSEGEVIFDYLIPEGVVWKDIKFRTNMGSLYITIPIMYPHFYSIASIDEKGILV